MKGKISLLSASIVIALFGAGADATAAGPGVSGDAVNGTSSISLTVGLAFDNGTLTQCGTNTALSATVGDQVNFCYIVTNHTSYTLNYQSLSDSSGVIFTDVPGALAPGGTLQFNRIVTAGATESPAATWTAQDALPGYASSAGTYAWIDASTGTTITPPLGDDTSAAVVAPFPIAFYGATSPNLCVDNNGFILFNTTTCPTSGLYTNATLPSSTLTSPAILPFWDDLYTGGSTYYTTVGTAPNRQFVVEWFNKDTFDTHPLTTGYTFEVVFNEVDGTIDFNYQTVITTPVTPLHDSGISATVGLQGSGTLANQFSYNAAVLTNGQNIHWAATTPHIFMSAPVTVTLDVGAPVLALSPTSLSGSATVGARTTTTLNIGNTGDRDLHWNLTSAPPTAHFPAIPGTPRFSMDAPNAAERALTIAKAAPVKPGVRKDEPAVASPLVAAIPAYALQNGAPSNFGSFDVLSPGVFTVIAPAPATGLIKTGTFVNNDFTKEYVGDIGGTAPSRTATINTTTGAVTPLGGPPATTGEGWVGLKWDGTTHTLFGAGCGLAANPSCHLYTVDPTTGVVTQGPPVTGITGPSGTFLIDLAIDPRGLMYAIEFFTGNLVAIDKTTGAAQVIGSTGVAPAYVQAMDFDLATNTLYWASFDTAQAAVMYSVNTTTGAVTAVNPPLTTETFAFAIAVAGGPCATPTTFPWLSYTPSSGTTPQASVDPVTVTLDATTLTAGPYHANVCVNTNDQNNAQVAVPVTFTVNPPSDTIFADGFDGP